MHIQKYPKQLIDNLITAQFAEAEEYTDCILAEE